MENIYNRIFDNLFFTRVSIKKIKYSKLLKQKNKNKNINIFYIKKNKNEYSKYDDDYYNKFDFLKKGSKVKNIDIRNAFNYFKDNIDILRKNKNNILVGYIKSIAWIYRFLKHNDVNVRVLI